MCRVHGLAGHTGERDIIDQPVAGLSFGFISTDNISISHDERVVSLQLDGVVGGRNGELGRRLNL